jgi:hypothetical protein
MSLNPYPGSSWIFFHQPEEVIDLKTLWNCISCRGTEWVIRRGFFIVSQGNLLMWPTRKERIIRRDHSTTIVGKAWNRE